MQQSPIKNDFSLGLVDLKILFLAIVSSYQGHVSIIVTSSPKVNVLFPGDPCKHLDC